MSPQTIRLNYNAVQWEAFLTFSPPEEGSKESISRKMPPAKGRDLRRRYKSSSCVIKVSVSTDALLILLWDLILDECAPTPQMEQISPKHSINYMEFSKMIPVRPTIGAAVTGMEQSRTT